MNMDAVKHKSAKGCFLSMGITSENVASRFDISREKQDYYALHSQKRAKKAQEEGKFKEEIVKINTKIKDAEGKEKEITGIYFFYYKLRKMMVINILI
jgi:acetyl-CoA acyltransferase 1